MQRQRYRNLFLLSIVGVPVLGLILGFLINTLSGCKPSTNPAKKAVVMEWVCKSLEQTSPDTILFGILLVCLVSGIATWLVYKLQTVADFREAETARDIVLKEVKRNIEIGLNKTLHENVLFELDKQDAPEYVSNPRQPKVLLNTQAKPEPTKKTIIEIFDDPKVAGRLLILGLPGAGKTTTLLQLARELVKRAEEENSNEPVPVLFDLSNWKDDKQPIADWLAVELTRKHPAVGLDLAKQWVQNHQLLPLLDGLDELQPHRQGKCVQRINELLGGEHLPTHLVVCSRIKELERYVKISKLALDHAIRLLPLNEDKIREFLHQMEYPELWSGIQHRPDLLKLMQTPLFLSMMVLAANQLSIEEWQQCQADEARRQFLFDAFVSNMLTARHDSGVFGSRNQPPIPTPPCTKNWLGWLAFQLQGEELTEFFVETMQPNWLITNSQRWLYRLVFGLFAALFGGLFVLFLQTIYGSTYGVTNGLILGSILGLIFGLWTGWYDIKLVEVLQFPSTHDAWKRFLKKFIAPLVISSPFGLLLALDSERLLLGLIVGLGFGLTAGLIEGLKGSVQSRAKPNQGIQNSLKNFWLITFISYPVGFGFSVLLQTTESQSLEFSKALLHGVWVAFLISFIGGGGVACVQYLALRLVLQSGKATPWNFAQFLDYAEERRLIQQVGGGYRFIHSLLQKHVAEYWISTLKLPSNDAWAIAKRGNTYRLLERYPEALQDLNRAAELSRKNAWIVAMRGKTHQAMEHNEAALKDIDQAIKLAPKLTWVIAKWARLHQSSNYVWAITCRAETYFQMERYLEALKDVNQLIALDSKDVWAIACRAETYFQTERYLEALKDVNQLIALDSKDVWAITCRGQIYLMLKRYSDALANFKQASDLAPDSDWYLYNLAITYKALKQFDEAQTSLRRAIQLAQQELNRNPQNFQNTLDYALYHVATENQERAVYFYQDALSEGTPLSSIKEAIRDLQYFLKVFPQHPWAWQIVEELENRTKDKRLN